VIETSDPTAALRQGEYPGGCAESSKEGQKKRICRQAFNAVGRGRGSST
jgi:hypothetical protein